MMWPEERPENNQRGQGEGPYIDRERDERPEGGPPGERGEMRDGEMMEDKED